MNIKKYEHLPTANFHLYLAQKYTFGVIHASQTH